MDPLLRPAVLVDLEPLTQQLRRIADALEARTPPAPVPVATPPPLPAPPLPTAPVDPDPPLDRPQQRVFEGLREWRRDRARLEGVPPYFVASDRSLREVARARPAALETLRTLRGFGPVKTAKYGTEILEVVAMA
ncbi:MAG: ATP-dependent helicase RecQ [Thermoplasmata archaeon]|nr:ATP-dependent helicase RecQ [Thermoplasmata archaeon]